MVDFFSEIFRLTLFLFSLTDNVIVFVPTFCLFFTACFAIVSGLLHRDFGRFYK